MGSGGTLLQADLGDLCQHKVACNIFLHLLAPSNRAYLPPHISALLALRPAAVVSTTGAPETQAAASDVLEEVIAPTCIGRQGRAHSRHLLFLEPIVLP